MLEKRATIVYRVCFGPTSSRLSVNIDVGLPDERARRVEGAGHDDDGLFGRDLGSCAHRRAPFFFLFFGGGSRWMSSRYAPRVSSLRLQKRS